MPVGSWRRGGRAGNCSLTLTFSLTAVQGGITTPARAFRSVSCTRKPGTHAATLTVFLILRSALRSSEQALYFSSPALPGCAF